MVPVSWMGGQCEVSRTVAHRFSMQKNSAFWSVLMDQSQSSAARTGPSEKTPECWSLKMVSEENYVTSEDVPKAPNVFTSHVI